MAAAPSEEIRSERVRANGLDFHVAACGQGDRLALCLHGFPETHYSWRYQLPLLARLGYRAWAPDLRGYGESDRPPHREDYAIEALLGDVAGLIDAARASRVVLIGHDWGGILAWLLAIRRVRELERLVVMNVPHPGPWRAAWRHSRQWLRSWYVLFFQLPRLPEWLLARRGAQAIGEAFRRTAVHPERFPEEVTRVYREAALRPGALTAMLNYYRALVLGGGMRRQLALGLPPIGVPTLLLWGVRDVALSLATTYGTEAWVRDLTVRYLPAASHWVQQDAPELVNEMLAAWLEGREVPQAPGAERVPRT